MHSSLRTAHVPTGAEGPRKDQITLFPANNGILCQFLTKLDDMKQRITYFLPEGKRVDPADIRVENDSLNFTKTHEAAEEWRLTLSLDDLPDEVDMHTPSN